MYFIGSRCENYCPDCRNNCTCKILKKCKGLLKSFILPKFKVCCTKIKNLGQQCGFQKIWNILLSKTCYSNLLSTYCVRITKSVEYAKKWIKIIFAYSIVSFHNFQVVMFHQVPCCSLNLKINILLYTGSTIVCPKFFSASTWV